MELYLVLPRG